MQNGREATKEKGVSIDRYALLSERVLDFAATVIKLTYTFPNTSAGKHIASQLARSATSIGANYEESRGAESRPDFIHKPQVAFKEAKGTVYWLKPSAKLELASPGPIAAALNQGPEGIRS